VVNKKKVNDLRLIKQMKAQQKEISDKYEERQNIKDEAKKIAEKARFTKDLEHFNDIRNIERNRYKTQAELA
jgi:hypothetical protein